jgi:hypothetical protein
MAKKRKTREQKIISQLRRQLGAKQETYTYKEEKETKTEKIKPVKKATPEAENKLYGYDQSLIKGDILKTLYLSVFFFALIGFFYWYFNSGGATTLKFFHL